MELINKLKRLEKEKADLVKKHLSEIVNCRFTYEELGGYLSHINYYRSQADIVEYIKQREIEIEDEESGLDFNFYLGINKYWGIFDVYYLKDRDGRLYITEISVDDC